MSREFLIDSLRKEGAAVYQEYAEKVAQDPTKSRAALNAALADPHIGRGVENRRAVALEGSKEAAEASEQYEMDNPYQGHFGASSREGWSGAASMATDVGASLLQGGSAMIGGLAQLMTTDYDQTSKVASFFQGINEALESTKSFQSKQSSAAYADKMAKAQQELAKRVNEGTLSEEDAMFFITKEAISNLDLTKFIDASAMAVGSIIPMMAISIASGGLGAPAAGALMFGGGAASAYGATKEMIASHADTIPDTAWRDTKLYRDARLRNPQLEDRTLINMIKSDIINDGTHNWSNVLQAAVSGIADRLTVGKLSTGIVKPIVAKGTLNAAEAGFQVDTVTGLAQETTAAALGRETTIEERLERRAGTAEMAVAGAGGGVGGHLMSAPAHMRKPEFLNRGDAIARTQEDVNKAKEALEDSNLTPEQRAEKQIYLDRAAAAARVSKSEVFENSNIRPEIQEQFPEQTNTTEFTKKVKELSESKQITDAEAIELIKTVADKHAEAYALQQQAEAVGKDASSRAEKSVNTRVDRNAKESEQARQDLANSKLGQQIQNTDYLGNLEQAGENATPEQVGEAAKGVLSQAFLGSEGVINLNSLSNLSRHLDNNTPESLGITQAQYDAITFLANALTEMGTKVGENTKDPRTAEMLEVQDQIKFSPVIGEGNKHSAVTFARTIAMQLQAGNVNAANATKTQMQNLIRSQKNKLDAWNESYREWQQDVDINGKPKKQHGNLIEFESYGAMTGEPVPGWIQFRTTTNKKGVTSPSTLISQQIESEINTLTKVANRLEAILANPEYQFQQQQQQESVSKPLPTEQKAPKTKTPTLAKDTEVVDVIREKGKAVVIYRDRHGREGKASALYLKEHYRPLYDKAREVAAAKAEKDFYTSPQQPIQQAREVPVTGSEVNPANVQGEVTPESVKNAQRNAQNEVRLNQQISDAVENSTDGNAADLKYANKDPENRIKPVGNRFLAINKDGKLFVLTKSKNVSGSSKKLIEDGLKSKDKKQWREAIVELKKSQGELNETVPQQVQENSLPSESTKTSNEVEPVTQKQETVEDTKVDTKSNVVTDAYKVPNYSTRFAGSNRINNKSKIPHLSVEGIRELVDSAIVKGGQVSGNTQAFLRGFLLGENSKEGKSLSNQIAKSIKGRLNNWYAGNAKDVEFAKFLNMKPKSPEFSKFKQSPEYTKQFQQFALDNYGMLQLTSTKDGVNWELDPKMMLASAIAATDTLLDFKSLTARPLQDANHLPIHPLNHLMGSLKSQYVNSPEYVEAYFSKALVDATGLELSQLMNMASRVELETALHDSIREYLGVTGDRNKDFFATETATRGLAQEVMQSLIEQGYIEVIHTELTHEGPQSGKPFTGFGKGIRKHEVTLYRLSKDLNDIVMGSAELRGDLVDSSALGRIFLNDKDSGIFFEEQDSKTKTVNRSDARLSSGQQKAIQKAEKIPHYFSEKMGQVFGKLGTEGLVNLFADGVPPSKGAMQSYLPTIVGRYTSVLNAWKTVLEIGEAFKSQAEISGKDIKDIGVFYKFAMSSVARLSPKGKYTPVSDTLVREMMIPNRHELDLTNENDLYYAKIALAQGLDVSIERQSLEKSVGLKDTNELLGGKLAEVVAKIPESQRIVRQMLEDGSNALTPQEVQMLKSEWNAAGLPLKPRTLKTIVELVQLQDALANGESKITSELYIEADGITNGYVMTSAILGAEPTDTWFDVMERGGISIGELNKPNSVYAEANSDVRRDNYTGPAEHSKGVIFANLTSKYDQYYAPTEVKIEGQNRAMNLTKLMETFLGYMKLGPDGTIEITRNGAKYPSLKINYGAGPKSIAKGLAVELVKEINRRAYFAYEEMNSLDAQGVPYNTTEVMARHMIPESADAVNEWNNHAYWFNDVINNRHRFSNDGVVRDRSYAGDLNLNRNAISIVNPVGMEFLAHNLQQLFTEPMQVGSDLFNPTLSKSMDALKNVTSKVSNILTGIHKVILDRKVNSLKSNPYKPRELMGYLSPNEQASLFRKELKGLNPFVNINGYEMPLFKESVQTLTAPENRWIRDTSISLNGVKSTKETISMPTPIGVGFLANFAISQGDAQTIVHMLSDEVTEAINRSLMVFDGIHFSPLDIVDGSVVVNKAVLQSMYDNPLRAVVDSLKTTLEGLNSYDYSTLSNQERLEIVKGFKLYPNPVLVEELQSTGAVFETEKGKPIKFTVATPELIKYLSPQDSSVIASELHFLEQRALEQEAMLEALKEIAISADQMASVGAVFNQEGRALNKEDAIEFLKQRTNEILAEKKSETLDDQTMAALEAMSEQGRMSLTEAIEDAGKVDNASGAIKLSTGGLFKLASWAGDRSTMKNRRLAEVLKTLLNANKNASAVLGSVEQVAKYIANRSNQINKENGVETAITPEQIIESMNLQEVGLRGFYSPLLKEIFYIIPTEETIVHEVVHSAIDQKIDAYFSGEIAKGTIEHTAVANIEKLYTQFMAALELAKDPDTNYLNFGHSINLQSFLNQDAKLNTKAEKLKEFTAWGLTDKDLQEFLQKVETDKHSTPDMKIGRFESLKEFFSNLFTNVLQMITGKGNIKRFNKLFRQANLADSLEFNSLILASTKMELATVANSNSMQISRHLQPGSKHANVYKSVNQIWDSVRARVPEPGTPEYANWEKLNKHTLHAAEAKGVIAEASAFKIALEHMNAMSRAGFLTTVEDANAFEAAATVLNLGNLNSEALTAAQKVYEEFLKNINVEQFLPENPTTHDYDVAQLKYETLLGVHTSEINAKGQSGGLQSFMALAATSSEFQQLVDGMNLPQVQKVKVKSLKDIQDTGVNQSIADFGNMLVEMAGNKIANMEVGVETSDQIRRLINTIAEKPSSPVWDSLGRLSEFTRKYLDTADDYVAEGLSKAMVTGSKVLPKAPANYLNTLAGTLGKWNDTKAAAFAETMLVDITSSVSIPKPIKEFLVDIIGRTEVNAEIFDMMKLVRNSIQRRRENLLTHMPELLKKKLPEATQDHWNNFTKSMMRLDVGSLDFQTWKEAALDINKRHDLIDQLIINEGFTVEQQAMIEELSDFIATGNINPNMPITNAYILVQNWNSNFKNMKNSEIRAKVNVIDQIATLSAMDRVNQSKVTEMLKANEEGMKLLHGSLVTKHKSEKDAIMNNRAAIFDKGGNISFEKGFVPNHQETNDHHIRVPSNKVAEFQKKGYTLVHKDPKTGVNIMHANHPNKAPYSQGIAQNAVQYIGNMDIRMPSSRGSDYVYNAVDKTYSRVSESALSTLNRVQDMATLIGVNQGRREEQAVGLEVNKLMTQKLGEMYKKDMSGRQAGSYINILDPAEMAKSPVLRDAVRVLSNDVKSEAVNVFGNRNTLWVRKDLVDQVIGYRSMSVEDFWSGNNTMPTEVNQAVVAMAEAVMGPKALPMLMKAQAFYENAVAEAKSIIVAKSFVVSAVNAISNAYHLVNLGVSPVTIARDVPKKLVEIEAYLEGNLREIELEVQLNAATEQHEKAKLRAQIASVRESYKNLSIWPLLERGEFSTVTKDKVSREDLMLTQGKFTQYMRAKLDKLPPEANELGKNILITKDSAVYTGLQKFVDYGDFISKAIAYDHMVNVEKRTSSQALAKITEEFINYDILPGRFRGGMEKLGLLWFYNFKIRSTKIALRRLRENPLRSIMIVNAPKMDYFGSLGMPINDNVFYKAYNGSLPYSMGPGMGLNSPMMHPAVNLVDTILN